MKALIFDDDDNEASYIFISQHKTRLCLPFLVLLSTIINTFIFSPVSSSLVRTNLYSHLYHRQPHSTLSVAKNSYAIRGCLGGSWICATLSKQPSHPSHLSRDLRTHPATTNTYEGTHLFRIIHLRWNWCKYICYLLLFAATSHPTPLALTTVLAHSFSWCRCCCSHLISQRMVRGVSGHALLLLVDLAAAVATTSSSSSAEAMKGRTGNL